MVPVPGSSSDLGLGGPVFRAQELGARLRSELNILQSSGRILGPTLSGMIVSDDV